MTDIYHRIATANYPFGDTRLTDGALGSYFDRCFDDALSHSGLYPAYGCVICATKSSGKIKFGKKPDVCADCGYDGVYELATFQARATVYGDSFTSAVQVLFKRGFGLELKSTAHSTRTHNLEASDDVAIAVKGSARRIMFPNGWTISLDRPGLLRSDTEKKAHASARDYKRYKSSGKFYVLTNALPDRLRGIRSDDVDGYFDLTRVARVESFAREVRQKISGDC